MKKVLVTGCAGFIGTNLIAKLLETKDYYIVGIDNFSPFYDLNTKLENVKRNSNHFYKTIQVDVTNEYMLRRLIFEEEKFDIVIHLAAQAGVSYSIQHPLEVIDTNIKGFDILLRMAHEYGVKKFIYASSSSVLGDYDGIYKQKSPYAVTKATNELQGKMYSELFKDMNIVGLRFFTVYGERMRPDLAIAKFTKAILNDEEIHVYGDGSISRDFTYVGDVADNILKVIETDTTECSGRVFDVGVGKGKATTINELIEIIKNACGREDYDKVIYEEGKPYDAKTTLSSISPSFKFFGDDGLRCHTDLEEGIKKYVEYIKKVSTDSISVLF